MQKSVNKLIDIGFKVIPLKEGGKQPHSSIKLESVSNRWIDSPQGSKEYMQFFWEDEKNANVGILVDDLVVIDADNEAGVKWCLENLMTPFKVITGKGMHFYYRLDKRVNLRPISKGSTDKGIDIKTGKNAYVVAPPSYHTERDRDYEWKNNDIPSNIREIPLFSKDDWTAIEEYLGLAGTKKKKEKSKKIDLDITEVLKYYNVELSSYSLHSKCPFPSHDDRSPSFRIDKSKNAFFCSCSSGDSLMFIARMEELLAGGETLSGEKFKQVMLIAREIDPAINSDFEDLQEKQLEIINSLNHEYFFLEATGNPVYRVNPDGTLTCLSIQNFKQSKSTFKVGNQTAATIWLESPLRRTFHNIVFSPAGNCSPLDFNKFTGWNVEPSPGECSNLVKHIKEVICSDKDILFEWVMDWIADIFQNPEDKPGTSIGLRGKPGVGKSSLFFILNELLGRYFLVTEDINMITGQFNDILQDKMLIAMEEAIWGGSIKSANNMKHKITGEEIMIEIKNGAKYRAKNFARYIAASNVEFFLHLDRDDRRWLIMEVSDKYKGDKEYFKQLRRSAKSEANAFLHYLLNRSIKSDLTTVPVTVEKMELKTLSYDAIEGWWIHCLEEGRITLMRDGFEEEIASFDNWRSGPICVSSRDLYESFLQHSSMIRQEMSPTKFGMLFPKRAVVEIESSRLNDIRSKFIPDLGTSREGFAKEIGFRWSDFAKGLKMISDENVDTSIKKFSKFS